VFPFDRLWYAGPNAVSNAIGFAKHRSRSHDAVIRVYGDAGNLIEAHEHAGQFNGGSLTLFVGSAPAFPSPRCASAIQIVRP